MVLGDTAEPKWVAPPAAEDVRQLLADDDRALLSIHESVKRGRRLYTSFQFCCEGTQMKQNESIKNLMTKSLLTATPLTSLREVATLFGENKIHHLPIVEGKRLVGLVSYSDILRFSFADAFNQKRDDVIAYLDSNKKITDVMVTNLKTMSDSGTIKEAAATLCQGEFHAVCVINNEGELAGIVTSTDLIRYLLDLY